MHRTAVVVASSCKQLMAQLFQHFSFHFSEGAHARKILRDLSREATAHAGVLLMAAATLQDSPHCSPEYLRSLQGNVLAMANAIDRLADLSVRHRDELQVASDLAQMQAELAKVLRNDLAELFDGDYRTRVEQIAKETAAHRQRLVELLRVLTSPK